MTTNNELIELRRLAEAATPGGWRFNVEIKAHADVKAACGRNVAITWGLSTSKVKTKQAYESRQAQDRKNAAFIAAANPAKIIELLDTVEAQANQIKEIAYYGAEAERRLLETIEKKHALENEIRALKSAEKTLRQMGYTNKGGEYWKPPLGKAPDFDLVDSLDKQIEALKADAEQDEALIRQMLKAINAMLTHMGMDEDDWNKPTFDQCRASENAARTRLGEGGNT